MAPVTAYAPGSVTAFFVPPPPDEPEAGSRGASFAIADGVASTVGPAEETTVSLDGEPTAFEPVERVLDRLGVDAAVSLRADVPVGYGFGASGAATLATALAADAAFELDRDRPDLLEAAHLAEMNAGTGLGDVFIQDEGGVVWNTGEGIRRTSATTPVEYTAFAGLSTAELLGDEAAMERVRTAGRRAMRELSASPTVPEVLELGRTFAEAAALLTDRVRERLAAVEAAGGVGTMAMIGETVVAADVEGVLEHRTTIDGDGARIVRSTS